MKRKKKCLSEQVSVDAFITLIILPIFSTFSTRSFSTIAAALCNGWFTLILQHFSALFRFISSFESSVWLDILGQVFLLVIEDRNLKIQIISTFQIIIKQIESFVT